MMSPTALIVMAGLTSVRAKAGASGSGTVWGLPRLFAQRNNQDSPNTTQATPQTVPDPEAPALALTEVNPAITI
ncbi:MAG: hypothetical protein AAFW84_33020, partial [Cyanobacteria bacterium J06635_15]